MRSIFLSCGANKKGHRVLPVYIDYRIFFPVADLSQLCSLNPEVCDITGPDLIKEANIPGNIHFLIVQSIQTQDPIDQTCKIVIEDCLICLFAGSRWVTKSVG